MTEKYLESIIEIEIAKKIAEIPEPKKIEKNRKEIINLRAKVDKLQKEDAPAKDILAVQQFIDYLQSDSDNLKTSIEREAKRSVTEQNITKWKNSQMFGKQVELPHIDYDGPVDVLTQVLVATAIKDAKQRVQKRDRIIMQDIPRKVNEFVLKVDKEQTKQYYEDLTNLYHIAGSDKEVSHEELLRQAATIATTDIQLVALPYGEDKEYITEDFTIW